MKVPQIRMESQLARIGMQQQFASLKIEQPKADINVEQQAAKLEISAPLGQLIIDQSQAWEETHLMSTPRLIEKQGQEAIQIAAEGTARRAEQGTQLMKIEQDIDLIVQHAQENGFRQQKTLSLKYMPSPFSVKIDYIPADVDLEVTTESPTINTKPNKPIISYEQGILDIYMEQYESLDIDYVNLFSTTV